MLGLTAWAATAQERPNILLIMADDTIRIAPVLGGTPPPENYDGATGPEIEPDDRPPIYPPVADSVTERPPGR